MKPFDGTKAIKEPRRHCERCVPRLAPQSENDESGEVARRIGANVREVHIETDQSPSLVLAGGDEITIRRSAESLIEDGHGVMARGVKQRHQFNR